MFKKLFNIKGGSKHSDLKEHKNYKHKSAKSNGNVVSSSHIPNNISQSNSTDYNQNAYNNSHSSNSHHDQSSYLQNTHNHLHAQQHFLGTTSAPWDNNLLKGSQQTYHKSSPNISQGGGSGAGGHNNPHHTSNHINSGTPLSQQSGGGHPSARGVVSYNSSSNSHHDSQNNNNNNNDNIHSGSKSASGVRDNHARRNNTAHSQASSSNRYNGSRQHGNSSSQHQHSSNINSQISNPNNSNNLNNSHINSQNADSQTSHSHHSHHTNHSHTSHGSKGSGSHSSTERIFVALYDYAARTDADLSFRRGDKMEILDRSGGGWWMAKHMDPQAILSRGEIRDRGYVPSNFIAKYRSLESYDWYFGQIRRNEAERTLMNQPGSQSGNSNTAHGAYLIRKAETRAGEFSLSLRDGTKIKHYRIRTLDQGGYFIAQTTPFQTLPDLIQHYTEHSDGLCCRLTRPAKKCEMKPMTQGLSHDTVEQYEVPARSFQKIKKLGGGNFGDVFEGLWNGSTKVAIKCLKGSNVNPEEFMAEAEHMRKLGSHTRLMPLYFWVFFLHLLKTRLTR